MSDGGKERGKNQQTSSKKSRPSGDADFGHAIAKIAVAQICESNWVSRFSLLCERRSVGDCGPVHLLSRQNCEFLCEFGWRNVCDVIQGIQDMSLSCGFRGASDVRHCLVSSDVVREIAKFVSTEAEVPFFRPIPRLPVPRVAKSTPCVAQIGEAPVGNHIPDWLRRLPDPHTYLHTATDAKADMVEQTRQQRKAERPLLSLQHRLACSGAAGFQPTNGVGNDGKDKQVDCSSNPFLAPPLSYGEKEASEITGPQTLARGCQCLRLRPLP